MSSAKSKKITALLVVAFAAGPLCYGASITGAVKGVDGAPFKGAFVQTQNAKTKITVSVLSDKDGRYHVDNLPAGEYAMRIRAVGYTAAPKTGLTLLATQSASFDWALQNDTVHWNDLRCIRAKNCCRICPARK